MTLSATGDAETPAGGSVCMRCEHKVLAGWIILDRKNKEIEHQRNIEKALAEARYGYNGNFQMTQGAAMILLRTLKSRMRRRRADVDMMEQSGDVKR